MKYPTEKEILKKLGSNIASIRKKMEMSQADLCYEIDIDLSTLSRLERGLLNVTYNTLYKIASYFKIDMKDLFTFKG